MKAATMAAIASRATGTAHHRQRRRGGGGRPPSSVGAASTIESVVSGLMVSLGVVVAAILAVVFLVFSDQPATERLRNSRARSNPGPRSPSAVPRAAIAPGTGP